jgi:hypothetical protein
MIECKAYNILLSRIRFWKLATTTYREVNAFWPAPGLDDTRLS